MKKELKYSQFYLRLAIGLGFIYAVLDRIGWIGDAGQANIAWGNWDFFLAYTASLLPFISKPLAEVMGLLATLAEVVFGLMLIIGFKTRYVAIGSAILTLFFALSMAFVLGFKAPFNYSVFAVSAGAFVLAGLPFYNWSIDNLLAKPKRDSRV